MILPDSQFTAITCHLYFEKGDGIFILWYSNHKKIENSDDVQRTLVSPLLNNIHYCYYKPDDDKWGLYNTPQKGLNQKMITPDFLLLDFEYEGEIREVPLEIPKTNRKISVL